MFVMTTRTILVFGKKRPGYRKTLPKNPKLEKKHFLRLSGKWINSSGVSSQKLSYVYEAPAGAFISAKLIILEISDMPILEKVCISLYLVPIGPYLVPIGPYLALLGPIWPYLAVLGPIWLYWVYLALFGPIGLYLAILGPIWPWQLTKSVTQKVPAEDTETRQRPTKERGQAGSGILLNCLFDFN